MHSKATSFALWAAAGLLCLLFSSLLLHLDQARDVPHVLSHSKRAEGIVRGPAHQNPAKAPPEPMPEAVEQLNSELSSANFLSARDLHMFGKRDALRCDNGPCVDGSCCSKDKICGFGPDYCGDGCRSQCNATAMCGEYSENGEMPCGMKLCCSAMGWCGTTDIYCHNADPVRGTLPCQAGYGSCSITGSPSCAEGGGSTNGRTVGYYQSWNVRDRACNKVSPKQLNTKGYTHLFYSFASVDPASFKIAPAHSDDPAMMREFTSLSKGGKLQTWIAVGGFDFSDPGTKTHTTWSDLCSTKERRAAFISSVKDYMDEYGFQGVDLDWEYPGAPERGGRKLQDVRNLVALVREMRAAYGKSYGISVTLAPDYWYLRWFDAKGMEQYVDFFGFMAYDLHGSWDQDVKALGKLVRGQADIREISNNTVPLWFDGLNPAKINFGLAMYGRGYTLTDPTCNQLLCPFSGPSKPAPCTNFQGVMSLLEIQQLIKRRGLKPQYLEDSMMKQITWDDQWIGYDDEETFAAKKRWADGKCFGGTMIWSIDFQVSGSGDSDEEKYGDVVYVGTEAYEKPTAQCLPPCIMVFPPSSLSKPTVITMPAYTASLEVGSTTTTVVVRPTPQTSTVTVINFFNYYVTTSQKPGVPITLRPSFEAPPATVVVTGQDGKTTSRTVEPPPLGVPTNPGQDPNDPNQPGTTSPGQSPGEPATDWPWIPPPTPTPDEEPDPDQDEETPDPPVWTEPGDDDDDDDTPVPVPWPSGTIEPVDGPQKPKPSKGDRVSCTAWFFFICISWDELKIKIDFWDIILPPGEIGPGPPPLSLLKLPSGWTVGCKNPPCLPPWPKMSIGPNGQLPSIPPKPNPCEPTTAKLTIESTSYGTITTQGTVRTTATKTFSREFPMVGCAVKDAETAITTKACDAPTKRAVALEARNTDSAVAPVAQVEDPKFVKLEARAPPCNSKVDAIIWPANHKTQLVELRNQLETDKGSKLDSFNEIVSHSAGFTAFFYLTNVDESYLSRLRKNSAQFKITEEIMTVSPLTPPAGWTPSKRSLASEMDEDDDLTMSLSNETEHLLEKRAIDYYNAWAPSHICVPPGQSWDNPINGYQKSSDKTWKYMRHDSECQGQFAYVIEQGYNDKHSKFSGANIKPLDTQNYGNWRQNCINDNDHGTKVTSMLVGVCPLGKLTIVPVRTPPSKVKWHNYKPANPKDKPPSFAPGAIFQRIEQLVVALEQIAKEGHGASSVVVMSFKLTTKLPAISDCFFQVLQELDSQGAVLVTSGGNSNNRDEQVESPLDANPALWASDKLPNLIVAGSTDKLGRRALSSRGTDDQVVYAPGKDVDVARGVGDMGVFSGTSFAAPMVAGLVAYYRALPGPLQNQLKAPGTVKKLVLKMRRSVRGSRDSRSGPEAYVEKNAKGQPTGNKYGRRVPFIWNGHLKRNDVSCLVQPDAQGCPKIDLADNRPVGECGGARRRGLESRQDDGDICTWEPEDPENPEDPDSPGEGPWGGQGPTKTVTYNSGTPSPTCTASCGTLCTGYWCRPDRTESQPPHFTDPTRLPGPTHLPDLPDLPGNDPLPVNCISSTTVPVCNGAGVGKVCVTSTRCLTTGTMGPFPTLPPEEAPIPSNCASVTSWTQCALGPGGGKEACVTHSSCAATKTKDPQPTQPGKPTVPSGFPKPVQPENVYVGCSPCSGLDGKMDACNEAARVFLNNPDKTFASDDKDTNTICREGKSGSETYACVIRLELLDDQQEGQMCVWKGSELANWWSLQRGDCWTCGWTYNDVSQCFVTSTYAKSCKDI